MLGGLEVDVLRQAVGLVAQTYGAGKVVDPRTLRAQLRGLIGRPAASGPVWPAAASSHTLPAVADLVDIAPHVRGEVVAYRGGRVGVMDLMRGRRPSLRKPMDQAYT